jgi:hypothetical protein
VNVADARTLDHETVSGGQYPIGNPDASKAMKNTIASQNIGPMRKIRRI